MKLEIKKENQPQQQPVVEQDKKDQILESMYGQPQQEATPQPAPSQQGAAPQSAPNQQEALPTSPPQPTSFEAPMPLGERAKEMLGKIFTRSQKTQSASPELQKKAEAQEADAPQQDEEPWLRFVKFADKAMKGVFYGLLVLVPFFFSTATSEMFELNKQLILLIGVLLMFGLWSLKVMFDQSYSWRKTPFTLLVVVFVAVGAVSTIWSDAWRVSLLGQHGRFHESLISMVLFAGFFLMATQTINGKKDIQNALKVLLGVGSVLALISICQFFGKYPLDIVFKITETANRAFNPFGSLDLLAIYLAMLVPVGFLLAIASKNMIERTIGILSVILMTISIGLISVWQAWLILAIGVGVVLVFQFQLKQNRGVLLLLGVIAMIAGFFFIPGLSDKLYEQFNVSERQLGAFLDAQDSATTALGTLDSTKRALIGSGPGTFVYDYMRFRPESTNAGDFWTSVFNRSFSEFFDVLAMLGIAGFAVFSALFLRSAKQGWLLLKSRQQEQDDDTYLSGVIGWLGVAALLVMMISSSHTAFAFGVWTVLVLVAGSFTFESSGEQQTMGDMSLRIHMGRDVRKVVVGAIALLVVGTSIFGMIKVYGAELDFRKSLKYVQEGQAAESYTAMENAIKKNDMFDVYHLNSASLLMTLANAATQQEGFEQQQEVMNQIAQYLEQSQLHAQDAVRVNPLSSSNQKLLGDIYRSSIAFVGLLEQENAEFIRNADTFALSAYQQAIRLNPSDPRLYNELGVYLAETQRINASLQQFIHAIWLKADYPQVHINLGVIYSQMGNIEGALEEFMTVQQLIPDGTEGKDEIDQIVQTLTEQYQEYQKQKQQQAAEAAEAQPATETPTETSEPEAPAESKPPAEEPVAPEDQPTP